jgi:hypothetical protein
MTAYLLGKVVQEAELPAGTVLTVRTTHDIALR